MPSQHIRGESLGRGPGRRGFQPGAGSCLRQDDLLEGAALSSLYNTAPAKDGIERHRAHSGLGKAAEKAA
jgi:hypothetical protein